MYVVQRSVCSPKLQENIFTLSAIDNLDHNPSPSTAKDSFHGTGISIFQFQTNQDDSFKFELSETSRNNHRPPSLPSYYTNVKPTKSTPSTSRIYTINSMNFIDVDHFDESEDWFNYIHNHLDDEEMLRRCNRASFCASQVQNPSIKYSSVMLPLLQDKVATHGMVRHTMDVIDQVHKKLKLDQPLVITADQPVYVIGKQIQWLYPDEYGDQKVLLMMGPLHIEISFFNLLGNWLESNGWIESLVKAKITSPGEAGSCLSGSHPKCSRFVHLASFCLLMNHSKNDQSSWMTEKKKGYRLSFCTGVRSWN